MKLLTIGEAMAELRRDNKDGWRVGFAGDTFNTAVYAARILGGGVGFLSRAGEDPLSADLRDFARAEGLDPSLIARDPARQIGMYSVSTDGQGERSFHYWRNQSAARQMFADAAEAAQMPQAEVIYLSGITLAILSPQARETLHAELLRRKATQGTKIAFDSNYRPHLWDSQASAQSAMSAFWQLADIALPSIDDEQALFGGDEASVVARFAQGNHARVAIKRGSRGPLDPSLATHPVFAPAERVVDTTAAGDSFNAGYLAGYLSGAGNAECLLQGHALASQVVGAAGAIIGLDV